MKIQVSKDFKQRYAARIERYQFEVGVLQNRQRREAKEHGLYETPDLKTYAGGPARKVSTKSENKTNAEVLIDNMKRLNTNLLSEPFQDKSKPLRKFVDGFLKMATGQGFSMKRVENLLQAVVRNPILKKEYGGNSSTTADNKGFDRHLIDTGQMFKSIKARGKRVGK